MPRPKPSILIDLWDPDNDWMQDAACHSMAASHPDMFYPDPDDIFAVETAKSVCNTACRVRGNCLEYALSLRDLNGVWGGCSESERRLIIKHRAQRAS